MKKLEAEIKKLEEKIKKIKNKIRSNNKEITYLEYKNLSKTKQELSNIKQQTALNSAKKMLKTKQEELFSIKNEIEELSPLEQSLVLGEQKRVEGVQDWELVSTEIGSLLGARKINGVLLDKENQLIKKHELLEFISQQIPNCPPNIEEQIAKKVNRFIKGQQVSISKYEIVFKNGKYNLSTRKFTKGEFESLNRIPYNYNKNAKSDYGKEILDRYVGNQVGFDTQIFEAMGLMMAQDKGFDFKTAIFADGNSNYGKSFLFEELIQPAIGASNIGNVDFSTLDDQEVASFMNKTGVYDSDMNKGRVSEQTKGTFKRATGDGILKARVLYQDKFTFSNYATIWINCNGLPNIIDRGSGGSTENRMHVIKFTVNVKDKFNDPKIGTKVNEKRKEISEWLLANAVHALSDALDKGVLTTTELSKEIKKEALDQDPVLKFIKNDLLDRKNFKRFDRKPTHIIYQAYQQTHLMGIGVNSYNIGSKPVGIKSFNASLADAAIKYNYVIYKVGNHKTFKYGKEEQLVKTPYGDFVTVEYWNNEFQEIFENNHKEALRIEEHLKGVKDDK